MRYLLDTNIISAVLNRNKGAEKKLEETAVDNSVCFSMITYYEIRRGLLAVGSTRKMKHFNDLCEEISVILLDDLRIADQASQIFADLKKQGQPIQDADILIAGTALLYDMIVVTDDRHFQRIPGLTVENWLRE
jgi:tRNA(fMet)-specific endonuclease VapC